MIEEVANSFVGQDQPFHEGVTDEQGAEFLRVAMYAGMQTGMITAHFMLYHRGQGHWNDISHPVNGELRRAEAIAVLEAMRETDNNAPEGSLILENPRGKEIGDWPPTGG